MGNAVYVVQFGAVWKLCRKQWLDLCKTGAEGWGYDLPQSQMLKWPP